MDRCIICLDDKNLISYKQCCKVLVHKTCIDKWNKKNNYKCIICRKSDSGYNDQLVEFDVIIDFNSNKFILVLATIFIMMIIVIS